MKDSRYIFSSLYWFYEPFAGTGGLLDGHKNIMGFP